MNPARTANQQAADLARAALEKEQGLLFEAWRALFSENAVEGDEEVAHVEQPGNGVIGIVRVGMRMIDSELHALYSGVAARMAVVAPSGAGQPLTASGARSHGERLRFDATDVDIAVRWTAKWMEVEWLVEPASPDTLILFLEDPSGAGPLSAIALDASGGRCAKKRLTQEQLGFDPTSRPWRIRVGSAHDAG